VSELLSEYHGIREKVERVVTEGDYIISLEASGALAKLMKVLRRLIAPGLDPSGLRGSSLLLDDLEVRRSKIESCLEFLRLEAQRDLQVRSRLLVFARRLWLRLRS
jgi:hypothetical protein